MEQVIKLEEIKQQFDFVWVLLTEQQFDESFRLLAGKVVGHSRNQHEITALTKKQPLALSSSSTLWISQQS